MLAGGSRAAGSRSDGRWTGRFVRDLSWRIPSRRVKRSPGPMVDLDMTQPVRIAERISAGKDAAKRGAYRFSPGD